MSWLDMIRMDIISRFSVLTSIASLSFIEYRTPAIYHACDTVLHQLDHVQESFLKEVGVSEVDALIAFKLAPLKCRRDMAMLGLIHRTVLGKGPHHFQTYFFRASPRAQRDTRAARRRHTKQLHNPRGPAFSEQLRRSVLGLVAVYKLLPQEAVATESVSQFQGYLQSMLKDCAVNNVDGWQNLFSPRVALYMHLLR